MQREVAEIEEVLQALEQDGIHHRDTNLVNIYRSASGSFLVDCQI